MKKFIVIFLFFLIASCKPNKPEVDCDNMPGFVTYHVAEGFHDFLPNNQPLIVATPVVSFKLILHETMWWEFNGDNDYFDISKILGFTDAASANNRTSAILGWRPFKDGENSFELFGFVNHSDATFNFNLLGVFDADQELEGIIEWSDNVATFSIKMQDSTEYIETTLPVSNELTREYRAIGGWFGGNDTAPQDMCFYMSTDFYL